MRERYDHLDRAIDALLDDRRPDDDLSAEERELLRVAAYLKSARPGATDPRPEYLQQMANRIQREWAAVADAAKSAGGGSAVASAAGGESHPPTPVGGRPYRRVIPLVSRRALLIGAASFAAGVAISVVGRRLLEGETGPGGPPEGVAVEPGATWWRVASLAELPPDAVVRFTAGSRLGHLIRRGEAISALSAICTDKPCLLDYQAASTSFLCPCHGIEFGLNGQQRTGLDEYSRPLPPLPPFPVRVVAGDVYVWSA